METRFEIKENGNMTDIVLSIETLNTRAIVTGKPDLYFGNT